MLRTTGQARVLLCGVPFDEYSSFARGAAEGPARIREELRSEASNTWTELGVDIGAPGVLSDAGDVEFHGVADPWEAIQAATVRVLDTGAVPILLGGDHSITPPILRAFRPRHSRLSILQFDAHPDLYDEYEGNRRSHACPFARVMEEGLADHLVQVGIRAATGHHREQIERFGVEVFEARRIRHDLRLRFDTPIYVSLDMDALDPAYAPGVSHREPGGLSVRQILNILLSLEAPVVGADIVEYNPRRDVANLTATVAAKFVKEIAGRIVRN